MSGLMLTFRSSPGDLQWTISVPADAAERNFCQIGHREHATWIVFPTIPGFWHERCQAGATTSKPWSVQQHIIGPSHFQRAQQPCEIATERQLGNMREDGHSHPLLVSCITCAAFWVMSETWLECSSQPRYENSSPMI